MGMVFRVTVYVRVCVFGEIFPTLCSLSNLCVSEIPEGVHSVAAVCVDMILSNVLRATITSASHWPPLADHS